MSEPETINFASAKKLVMDRLRQWLNELPASERNRPRKVIDFKTYSVNDLIAEVQRESVVGVNYVFGQAKRMNYLVEG